MKTVKDNRFEQHATNISGRAIFLLLLLILVSLALGSLPVLSFGQDFTFPPTGSPAARPAPSTFKTAANSHSADHAPMLPPATPPLSRNAPPGKPGLRAHAERTASATREPTLQDLRERPELLRSVAASNHPLFGYFEPPKSGVSQITGQTLSVAELLDGVGSAAPRRQLLSAYWELAGSLAEYNMRYDAELRINQWYRQAETSGNAQRSRFLVGPFHLAQQQCRAAEIAFIKKQWQLAEQIKRAKGTALEEKALPIPCDYPLSRKYATYADKIARTERARYLGQMIPLQEKLVGAKQTARMAADTMLSQAMNGGPDNAQELILAQNLRMQTFSELVESLTEYNKMIAEYATETIGPGVGQYRLIGALIELPKFAPNTLPQPNSMERPQPEQLATPPRNQFGATPPAADRTLPDGLSPMVSASSAFPHPVAAESAPVSESVSLTAIGAPSPGSPVPGDSLFGGSASGPVVSAGRLPVERSAVVGASYAAETNVAPPAPDSLRRPDQPGPAGFAPQSGRERPSGARPAMPLEEKFPR